MLFPSTHDPIYYENNPGMKRTHIMESLWKKISWVKHLIGITVLAVWTTIATPAYADTIDNWVSEIRAELWISDKEEVMRRLQYQIDWVMAEKWLYYTLLSDAGFEVIDREWFSQFIVDFGWVLHFLHTRTNSLTGDDVNAAMNLYTTHSAMDENIEAYADAYDFFLRTYSDLDLQMEKLLASYGFEHHWLI